MSYLTLNQLFPEYIMNIINHICDSIINAKQCKSKIDPNTEEGRSLLNYSGLTGTYTRHFYNNICNSDKLNDIKYLEIGTWNGSSSLSAVYNNKLTGLFIDNWSQFNGDSNIFIENIKKYGINSKLYLLENDCWSVNLDDLDMGPFNVYLFDGDHSEEDHYKSLSYYYPVLDDVFIFIVDDWNWDFVRTPTFKAIEDLKLHILFHHEEILSDSDVLDMPNHLGKKTWWNGIGIFLLSKTSKSLI